MTFRERVYEVVKQVPEGKVATYGQIAAIIGSPRAARQVGFSLRALGINENNIPWWRIINSKGYLSINHGTGLIEKEVQRDLLIAEGVEVTEDFEVDLRQYLFRD